MKSSIFFKRPRFNVFVPVIVWAVISGIQPVLEIFRMMPDWHWVYSWGRIGSFVLLFFFVIAFPALNYDYLKLENRMNPKKYDGFLLWMGFIPVLLIGVILLYIVVISL